MEKTVEKKRGLAAIFALCPAAHVIAVLSAALIGAFFAVLGGVVGDTIGRFITWLIDRREARRKGKENEE